MVSLFDMPKVGIGPSSSHTVRPMKAGKQFADDLVEKGLLDSITRVVAGIYGSLSLTGKDHHTDTAIIMGLTGNEPAAVDVGSIPGFIRDIEERKRLLLAQGQYEVDFLRGNGMRFHNGNLPLHENGMQIHAYNGDEIIYNRTYYSISSGFIVDEEHLNQGAANEASVSYPFEFATELFAYYNETGFSLFGPATQNELVPHSKKEIDEYFAHVWQAMQACIDRGMNTESALPGPLRVPRRVSVLRRTLVSSGKLSDNPMNVVDWVNMFAPAVDEESAANDHVVTVPTNDTCGIAPAVLTYYNHFTESVNSDIYIRYFMVAGAIGALYKTNASVSGAEVGCQDEVGATCSMAAVGLIELLGDNPEQACVVTEIGMEHNLGLACDPVAGQVQVSCIERNAIASVEATNTAQMALRRASAPRVSLDKVIEATYEASKDMNAKYHETSHSGLAIKVQCN